MQPTKADPHEVHRSSQFGMLDMLQWHRQWDRIALLDATLTASVGSEQERSRMGSRGCHDGRRVQRSGAHVNHRTPDRSG
mmetsp:Transcript_13460/g.38479  ORF Transcript_13460/g.38479 Transcript_13460/m.38479 type:complete len:80 (-) Transcript_13460:804-1043(-)